jgi:hypothetical protein
MVTLLLGNPLLPVVSAATAVPDKHGCTDTAFVENAAPASSQI